MLDLNKINRDTIIICNNSYKEKILKEISLNKKILPIKFMTINEFIKNIYFDYTDETIYYLIKKYNYKYEVAKIYLDNMLFVSDLKYNNIKLDKLCELKKELIDNNLLVFNNMFDNYLKDKNIIVYNMYLDNFYINILNNYNVKFINDNNKKDKLTVYKFKDIDMEVEYIFNFISKLLLQGIKASNIKIINSSDDYIPYLKRFSKFYDIGVDLNNNYNILSTNIVNNFLQQLDLNDINESLKLIEKKYDLNNLNNLYIYNKIINVCNKYLFIKEKEIFKEFFINEVKNISIYEEKYNNIISIINIDDYVSLDDYVFVIGFNQGVLPKVYKDDLFISDALALKLNIDTSVQKNIKEKAKVKSILDSINNLIITYKGNYNGSVCYPSVLIDENTNIISYKDSVFDTYSSFYNKLKLSMMLDKLIKYGIYDNTLDIYYNTYNDINYLKYDNRFTGINKESLNKYLNNKLLLSYSSLDNYSRCSFRYYINNILSLSKYEDTFQIYIGNLYHDLLSKAFDEEFDFDKEFNDYLLKRNLNNKEKFFIKKLREDLVFIIDTIKNQSICSDLKGRLMEEKIYINHDNYTFMGIVDKILYTEYNNKTLVSIIDYKTGNVDINLNNIYYGIGMQLPIYLYLVKNSNKFNNIRFVGFYLQKILNNEINFEMGKDYLDIKKDRLKLIGYSNSDISILEKFDKTYLNSELIKGLKMTSNGFSSYSKLVNDTNIDSLISLVENKLDDASCGILNGKFDINPKKIGKENVGCKFCKFKDICFMSEKDIVYLDEKNDLSFLGGDNNA